MNSSRDLLDQCDDAVLSAQRFLAAAKSRVAAKVSRGDKIANELIDSEQPAAHGLAWLATYVECLNQLARWARRLDRESKFGEIERLLLEAGFAEYLAQIVGGIPMSQNEIVRPYDLGLTDEDSGAFWTEGVSALVKRGL